MKNNILFTSILLLVFCIACNKPEQIPAYIYVKPFSLTTDGTKEGANTSKIIDAWVYSEDVLLGAFTLPAEIPVLNEGDTKITIFPGIRNNGNNASPTEYFNYLPFSIQKKLVPTKTDTIFPSTTYDKNLTFKWIEDFEGSINTLNTNADKDDSTSIAVTGIDVKYGKRCALFKVDKKHPLISATTQFPFENLPQNSRVYVEMDYKCNVPIFVEIYGFANGTTPKLLEAASFKEKSEWNKVYLNFSKNIKSTYTSYSFVFSALLPDESTIEQGEARIDNIKLVFPK
jgi:hypothetical protein